jgi:hypothetical protein
MLGNVWAPTFDALVGDQHVPAQVTSWQYGWVRLLGMPGSTFLPYIGRTRTHVGLHGVPVPLPPPSYVPLSIQNISVGSSHASKPVPSLPADFGSFQALLLDALLSYERAVIDHLTSSPELLRGHLSNTLLTLASDGTTKSTSQSQPDLKQGDKHIAKERVPMGYELYQLFLLVPY